LPVKPKKAHSKHRGDSPSRNISSDTYRKEGLDWKKRKVSKALTPRVKATSANPDQLGTDI
jgi:hypothetical protein